MTDSKYSRKPDKPDAKKGSTGAASHKQAQPAARGKRLRYDPFDEEKNDGLLAELKNIPRISFDAQRLILPRSQQQSIRPPVDEPPHRQPNDQVAGKQRGGLSSTHQAARMHTSGPPPASSARAVGLPQAGQATDEPLRTMNDTPSRPTTRSTSGFSARSLDSERYTSSTQKFYEQSRARIPPSDSWQTPFSLPYRSMPASLPTLLPNQQLLALVICMISVAVIIWMWPGSPFPTMSNWVQQRLFDPVDTSVRPPGDYNLQGPPSLNAQQIDQILAGYNSPAVGTGQIWLNLGRSYGIDPAFAVAFFILESSAGTNPGWAGLKPDGSTTHNIGNIICAGYATCYQNHRDYPSWDSGIEDWYRLILVEYIEGRELTTVDQILLVYCPFSDGCAPDRYALNVHTMVDRWRRGEIP